MKLLLHVGPPKTGTTSLQHALDENRQILIDHGIYYPQGAKQRVGSAFAPSHHGVFIDLKGWDYTYFNLDSDQRSWPKSLHEWMLEAREHSCPSLLISAEVLSYFDDHDWAAVWQGILEAEGRSEFSFEEVVLLYTERDLELQAESQYAEDVKHGFWEHPEVGIPLETDSINSGRHRIESLPSNVDRRFRFQLITGVFTYLRENDPPSEVVDLSKWFDVLSNGLGALFSTTSLSKMNARLPKQAIQELVTFNRVNTPQRLTSSLPFVDHNDDALSQEEQQALRRLQLFRHELSLSYELRTKAHQLELENIEIKATMIESQAQADAKLIAVEHQLNEVTQELVAMKQTRGWRLVELLRRLRFWT